MNEKIEKYLNMLRKFQRENPHSPYRGVNSITGKKYVKVYNILANGQHSATQFIDPETEYIYKANSWKQRGRFIAKLSDYNL